MSRKFLSAVRAHFCILWHSATRRLHFETTLHKSEDTCPRSFIMSEIPRSENVTKFTVASSPTCLSVRCNALSGPKFRQLSLSRVPALSCVPALSRVPALSAGSRHGQKRTARWRRSTVGNFIQNTLSYLYLENATSQECVGHAAVPKNRIPRETHFRN